MSVNVAKKYAGGGITDGTEVTWNKKPELSPELAAALGMTNTQVTPTSPTILKKEKNETVIDLLQDPNIRRNTVSSSDKISDGITMDWSKNKKTLTGDAAKNELLKREAAAAKNKKKGKKILGVKFGKKK